MVVMKDSKFAEDRRERMVPSSEAWDKTFDWWVGVAESSIDLMKSNPFFLQWMGIALQQQLSMKRWADAVMERAWRHVGLPPLKEITRLHEKATRIERKLGGLREEGLPRRPESAEGLRAPVRRFA